MSSAIDRENSLGLLAGKKLFYLSMIGRMPVSQDSSFINDYSEVKEQVIMVIEYLQQIKDSYFEQKHALEKQLNLLEIQLKENTGMIKMLEETNDSCYELFTPRNVNSKNKAKINELMEEQKSINESIENLKNSIKEYSSKIEQLDQIVEEENREIEIVQEYTETMTQQNIVSEDEKESSEDNLLDSMKNILNRLELCSQLIDIDPVRCRLELSSVMKILTDLIEEKDDSNDRYYLNDETAQAAQEIFENKELRALFDVQRDMDADDLRALHNMALALKRKERGNDDTGC